MINTLPLFCHECFAPWQELNETTGVCTNCDSPNIQFQFALNIALPTVGYDREDVKAQWQEVIDQLIDQGIFPDGTTVS